MGTRVSKRASSQVTPLTRAPWALMLAAREGHLEVVWYLADKRGAAIGAASADGCTALKSAAQEGHLEVWQLRLSQFTSGHANWQKSVQGQCKRPLALLASAATSPHPIYHTLHGQVSDRCWSVEALYTAINGKRTHEIIEGHSDA